MPRPMSTIMIIAVIRLSVTTVTAYTPIDQMTPRIMPTTP